MTSKIMTMLTPHASRFYAVAAISFFVYSTLALISLHLLRPDYAPASHTSIGCPMLALGLKRGGPTTITAKVGWVLLGIASIGRLVSAAFPTDLDDAPTTQTGNIHTISFLLRPLVQEVIVGEAGEPGGVL